MICEITTSLINNWTIRHITELAGANKKYWLPAYGLALMTLKLDQIRTAVHNSMKRQLQQSNGISQYGRNKSQILFQPTRNVFGSCKK